MESFASRLDARIRRLDTRVCLGIDPRPERHPSTHPDAHDGDPAKVARAVVVYFRDILDATADLVACVKLQAAFFERLGIPGMIAMAQLLADAKHLGIPVILDAKRGDIGATAKAYAEAYLGDGVFAADALTVNPYLGSDALEPFVAAAAAGGRGVFVLVKTSNPGSADLQDLAVNTEEGESTPLWAMVAELVRSANERALGGTKGSDDGHELERFGPVGAVVGGTHPSELLRARALLPNSFLLVPGFGAQGATADDVAGAFLADGSGAIVNASRTLTYVTDNDDYASVSNAAASDMRDAINSAIEGRVTA